MKNLKSMFGSAAIFCTVLLMVSSCNMDNEATTPDIGKDQVQMMKPGIPVPADYVPGKVNARENWQAGEGWSKADDILYSLEVFAGGLDETYSFNATLKAGEISGTFEVVDNYLSTGNIDWVKGEVTCMVFEDDCKTVRMTGIITDSGDPYYIGLYAYWLAEDNGNGGLDASTDIRFGADELSAQYHCEVGYTKEEFDLSGTVFYQTIEGNIKVKSMDCLGNVTGDHGN